MQQAEVISRSAVFPGGTVSSPVFPRPRTWRFVPSFDVEAVCVQRWLRFKSPRTKSYYVYNMDKFLGWARGSLSITNPQEFMDWAERQPKAMFVQDVMERFIETRKPSQRGPCAAALKSFLEKNGYERKLPKMDLELAMKNFHRGYRRKEILELMGFLDDKFQKLYVLVAKDSGLRASDVLSIEYHHLKPDLEAGLEFCHVYFEPHYYPPIRKKKYAGITFIGPNAVKLLKELIAEGKVNTAPSAGIFPFAYTAINEALRLAKRKAGLDERLQPSHGLRKFFENGLDKPEPPLDDVKKTELEGHTLGVRWYYREQEVEELRPLYQRVYPFLDLSEDAAVDSKVKTLRDEVKGLRDQLARYQAMESKVEVLYAEREQARKIVYTPRKGD